MSLAGRGQEAAKWMAVSAVIWALVWLLDIGSLLLADAFWPGWIGPIPTSQALLLHAVPWICWWLLSPVVFGIATRFRFGDGRRASSFIVHFGAAIATTFVTNAAMAVAQAAMQLGPRRFNVSMPGLTLYAAVAVTAIALGHRRREQELAVEVANAKLHALTSQLKPHFLYNALNSVAMLIRNDNRDAALAAVLGYADLLRTTIHSDGADVPLSKELATIDNYLAIERMRFPETLATRLVLPPDLALALVPSMILQPLVENALHHGVAEMESGAHLDVIASRSGDTLSLEVRDNGVGLPPGWAIDKAAAGETGGVGLSNTRSRLQQRYGARAGLRVYSAPEGGTVAVIDLPFQTAAS